MQGLRQPEIPVARTWGSPHAPARPAELQPPVPGGCWCRLWGALRVRSRLGHAQRPPGSALPRAAAAASLRASEVQPGGTGCRGGHRSARAPPAMPRGQGSPAVTSGDKAPYGDGEGRRSATARGRLRRGGWRGALLRPPGGGLHVQLLPLTRAYIQRRRESGVPAASSSEALRPRAGGQRAADRGPQPCARKHHTLGLGSRGGGQGGSSHFTLFREYEFTHKSRGWALAQLPGPPATETGSRSCTKWEQRGGRGPEQPSWGITGCMFGWEAAGQESRGCRNLLKTLRLFFSLKQNRSWTLFSIEAGLGQPPPAVARGGMRSWRGVWDGGAGVDMEVAVDTAGGWHVPGVGGGARGAARDAAWPLAADEGQDGEGVPRLPAARRGSCCGCSALYPLRGEHSEVGTVLGRLHCAIVPPACAIHMLYPTPAAPAAPLPHPTAPRSQGPPILPHAGHPAQPHADTPRGQAKGMGR